MKNLKKLSFLGRTLIVLTLLATFSCEEALLLEASEPSAPMAANSTQINIAKRWAPIHYMDVDATGTYALGGKSDYISAINYDGDWNAINNWNNTNNYALSAHVFYSVVETSTHYFLIYAFFHPRDWTDNPFLYSLDQHENDLEGVLLTVKKDGSQYGSLLGAVTVSHSDFYSYAVSGSGLSNGSQDIDGKLQLQNFNGLMRPVTAQEAKGHGLKAWPQNDINGDGVIYYPSMTGNAEVPADNYDTYVEYKLVDIFEAGGLWDQRFNTDLFFDANGGFKGDDFKTGGANAPWAWNDGNDGIVQGGEMATDPAKLMDNYFDGLGNFSHIYTDNDYSGSTGGVATFYQHCSYGGYAVSLKPGSYTLGQLQSYGISNDDISSLIIEGSHTVTLYQHDNFGGTSVVKTSSTSCLNGFNDEVSSIKIQ
ncbi:hypothetical protein [Marinoscillum pacificum]|uniref:hypothetical protein n=1 Tax=Marinoscillum pacificum TaxID=392723 RepID=UPI002158A003|nr:hypothetical protein [Marinoscillum pacificum]